MEEGRSVGRKVRWPAEWERQRAVWLTWPSHSKTWPGRLDRAQRMFARLTAAITRLEKVNMICSAGDHSHMRGVLESERSDLANVVFFDFPTNDVWVRDYGPVFVLEENDSNLSVVDWGYNAWGGKFSPWEDDAKVPLRIADALGYPRRSSGLIVEGGAIEGNGDGVLITTEAVLSNSNRNPGFSIAEIDNELERLLGCREVLWLGCGLDGDDTDGHIDNVVRFWGRNKVFAAVEPNERDPNHDRLVGNLERLREFRDSSGGGLEIVEIPLPDPIFSDPGKMNRLPASYLNFLILNDAVLVPVYELGQKEDAILGVLSECFEGRSIVPIDCREFLREGGAIHCLSMQEPAIC